MNFHRSRDDILNTGSRWRHMDKAVLICFQQPIHERGGGTGTGSQSEAAQTISWASMRVAQITGAVDDPRKQLL